MAQDNGLVLHQVSLAYNHNLERAGDLITQLHLAGGLPEGPTANEEILKKLDLQHADSTQQQEDATVQQFVFQGQCLILGDSGVGKTSLVKSLTGKPFDPRQPKTQGIDQSLVDEKWTNLSMKDLILGNLLLFYQKISIQLNLYGHGETNYVILRNLVNWRNEFNLDDTLSSFYTYLLLHVCTCPSFSNSDPPFISASNFYIFLYLYLVFFASQLFYTVLLFYFNRNYHFRLIVAIFYFIVRRRGLLIGAFPVYVFMLEFYHYGKISVNADGILLSIIIAGLSFVAVIFLFVGIEWQCSYPRQFKFKYKRPMKYVCFLPLLISVLVSCITCLAVVLFVNCFRGFFSVRNCKNVDDLVTAIFVLWLTIEFGTSAVRYIDIIRKWPCRGILKVVLIGICMFLLHCFTCFLNMCYIYMCFDSIIICVFLSDTLFREWQDIHKLGIEGNWLTAVVIEKQELKKKMLKSTMAMDEALLSLKMKILDFAGDKEYYAYHHMFLGRQAIYTIVFNMAEFTHDFGHIDEKFKQLQFWFESVCSHAPPKNNTPIFLVGTHRENMDKNSMVILDRYLRRYLWNTYCDELIVNDVEKLIFFPVENSKGNKDTGVHVLQKTIMSVAEKCTGCYIPLSWIRIQDAIISLKEKKEAKFCVTLGEFPKVFDNFICTNWSKKTLKYFHDKGMIIYLDRNQDLDLTNWVLLKPEILVEIIIQLVTPSPANIQERGLRCDWNLLQRKGMLTKSLLRSIISKVQENEEAMTAFLEEYDLICPLANKKVQTCNLSDVQPTHFVPSLLPMSTESVTPVWHGDDTDKKCYVFFSRFLPEPLFHGLLSRAHKLSKLEFPNGQTVLFRDAGKFWMSAWQPYCLKLMKEEKMIEVTFSCSNNRGMRPSDVLCQVFSMVDGICRRDFPFVMFHCGPACPSHKCPGHQSDYLLYSAGEEQVPRRHVYNVMPGRQGNRIAYLYCENHSFEEELTEWVP